ncbi:hypothetical protein CIK76_15710 [Glutamicibacter sp. BW80]|uniref:diaminopimelate epimerase n=1 Tax=unclassified Glutamicibacter TaxID=2627139 RepID=UPI000BB987A3|nr:diaminopimelate epimerase [Glutamicibacter sp. BW80]PCC27634.1 hypothetical protein CIK76_15710 [Glutamicibacter sp. BW80]
MSQSAQLRRTPRHTGRRRASALPARRYARSTAARGTTEVDFAKLSPTSNTTVLVTSQHPPRQYRTIAEQLLRAEHLHAEQVGFILPAESSAAQLRLHMAGDEFCANAAMALAALHASKQGQTGRVELFVEASGADQLLSCRVEPRDSGYRCQLDSPLPLSIEPYPSPGARSGTALVRYADSVHLVIECAGHGQGLREHAEQAALQLGNSEGVSVAGVMLYDPARGALDPLINVPALGSLLWERSCGSGTAALGAYLAAKNRAPVCASVRQPGGTMDVEADYGSGTITGLRVAGHVAIVAEGRAYIHD